MSASGWWKFEDNLVDSIAGNDAVPYISPVYADGVVGRCIDLVWGTGHNTPGLTINALPYQFYETQKFEIEFYLNIPTPPPPLSQPNGTLNISFVNSGEIFNSMFIGDYAFVDGAIYHLGSSQICKIKITYDNNIWKIYKNDILLIPEMYEPSNEPVDRTVDSVIFYVQWADSGGGYAPEEHWLIDELKINNNSGLGKKTLRFTDASKGSPLTHDLDFGDGTAHTTSLPVDHEYDLDAIGEPYTVDATLSVTGSKNQTDSITKTIDLSS